MKKRRLSAFRTQVFCRIPGIFAMVIAAGLVFTGCDNNGVPPVDPIDALFESHNPFSIQVTNLSREDLVAFRGSIAPANLIGGIPARQSNHGLPNNRTHFPDNPGHFEMLFVTREDYVNNQNNLSLLSNRVFTRIFIFWNGTAGDNSRVYEISDRLGGMHRLEIWNPSNFNVEFRENGFSGPTIGFATAGMTRTHLNVDAGDYLVFPVFKRFNSRRDIMETIIPTNAAGLPVRFSFGFPFDATVQQTQLLDLAATVGTVTHMRTGVVVLYVDNGVIDQGIEVLRGVFPMLTPSGNRVLSPGTSQEFTIDMPRAGSTFAETIQLSNLRINAGGQFIPVVTVENGNETFTLSSDLMYVVNISGSWFADTIQATIEIRSGEPQGPTPFAINPEDGLLSFN